MVVVMEERALHLGEGEVYFEVTDLVEKNVGELELKAIRLWAIFRTKWEVGLKLPFSYECFHCSLDAHLVLDMEMGESVSVSGLDASGPDHAMIGNDGAEVWELFFEGVLEALGEGSVGEFNASKKRSF